MASIHVVHDQEDIGRTQGLHHLANLLLEVLYVQQHDYRGDIDKQGDRTRVADGTNLLSVLPAVKVCRRFGQQVILPGFNDRIDSHLDLLVSASTCDLITDKIAAVDFIGMTRQIHDKLSFG